MLRATAFRIGQALLTLWVTSVLVWALLMLAPGDPARTVLAVRGVADPTPALIAATRRQLGLAGPVVPRYWHWLLGALHGNFGTSWQTGQPVMQEFAAHLPATARLTLTAMLIATGLALVLGTASAAAAGTWLDRVVRAVTLVMVVTPSFLIGLFVLNVLVVHLNLGVVVANGNWPTVGWPAVTLALGSAGYWGRVLRASLLDARSASYLLVSQARGASGLRRMLVHVLPNAAAPFLTVVGVGAAELLGGAPIVETVYSWPGVGQYTVQAIDARDLPVVVTYTMIAVATYIVASLLIDLALAAIDPRLQRQPAVELAARPPASRPGRGMTVIAPVPGAMPDDLRVAPSAGLLRRLSRHSGFRAGAVLALALAALALTGPLLANDPNVTNYANQLAAPGAQHWLGTDGAGRDEFARTVAGARTSLGAAVLVFALTSVIGIVLGTAAGFIGGLFDVCVSRLIDLMLGLPSLVLALAVVGALGPGFSHLVLAVTVTSWAWLAKLARSYTVGARTRPDVTAARMAGVRTGWILAGHVLPGAAVQALIAATLDLGDTILGLAGLSFLGLGVQPPTAEWGNMLSDSVLYDVAAPWLLLGPGLGIIAAVTAATLISDALRDCTDPSRA